MTIQTNGYIKSLPTKKFSYSDDDSTIRYTGEDGQNKTIVADAGYVFRFEMAASEIMYYQWPKNWPKN